MKSRLFTFGLILIVASTKIEGQTVGLFIYENEAFEGYTLFAPLMSTTTYLIVIN